MKNSICDTCENHQCIERNAPDTKELPSKHECEIYHHFIGNQYRRAVAIMQEYLMEGER